MHYESNSTLSLEYMQFHENLAYISDNFGDMCKAHRKLWRDKINQEIEGKREKMIKGANTC